MMHPARLFSINPSPHPQIKTMLTLHPSTVPLQEGSFEATLLHVLADRLQPGAGPADLPLTIELNGEIQQRLRSEIFHGQVPDGLLLGGDWHFSTAVHPGWVISMLNGVPVFVRAGADGVRTPAPVSLEGVTVALDTEACTAWLVDWPGITKLEVFQPDDEPSPSFASLVPNLTHLRLCVAPYRDLSPLATLTRLRSLLLIEAPQGMSQLTTPPLTFLGSLHSLTRFEYCDADGDLEPEWEDAA